MNECLDVSSVLLDDDVQTHVAIGVGVFAVVVVIILFAVACGTKYGQYGESKLLLSFLIVNFKWQSCKFVTTLVSLNI